MSDREVCKIVFVIGPCFDITQEEWNEHIKLAALKWMCHFISPFVSMSLGNTGLGRLSDMKWAYRFLDAPSSNFSATREWKDLDYSEISSFEEDVDFFLNTKSNVQNYNELHSEKFTGGAHRLFEELMSIVHDYNWETSTLATPTKKTKPRLAKADLKLPKSQMTSVNVSGKDGLPQNMVVVLSPTPFSQEELNAYFEWHVESVDFVSGKLMPRHLRLYFLEKYNISLFWVDTARRKRLHDTTGIDMMRKFLKSVGGDIIPLPVITAGMIRTNCTLDIDRNSEHEFFSAMISKVADELPTSALLGMVLKAKEGQDMISGCDHVVHVCEIRPKEPNESYFQLIKLWTLFMQANQTVEKDTSHPLCQACRFSGDSNPNLRKVSDAICDLVCPILTVFFPFTDWCKKGFVDKMPGRPETVLVILGTLPLAQISSILDSGSVSILNTVWCKVETSTSQSYDVGRRQVIVTEVYNHCTHCGKETPVYGCSKYVLLQPVSELFVLATFLSSTTHILDFILPRSNCHGKHRFTSLRSSEQPTDLDSCDKNLISLFPSQSFFPEIFERWCEVILGDGLHAIITDERQSLPDEMCVNKILPDLHVIEALQEVYSKEETEQIQQKLSTLSEMTSLQLTPLSLHEQYQNALEVVTDHGFPDNFPTCYESFVVTARSIVSTVFENMHGSYLEGSSLKESKKSECLIASVKEIKENQTRGYKFNLLVLQILLRMEFARSMSPSDDCIEMVDELSSILRLIALSISHAAMIELLRCALTDKYSDTCGRILYEIHNELMQPIPSCLDHMKLCKDDTDMSGDILSVPSIYSSCHPATNSARSSKSCGGMDSVSRIRRVEVSSSLTLGRQIEIPGRKKQKPESYRIKEVGDGYLKIKDNPQGSNKKPPSDADISTIHNIKKDLFCNTNEETDPRDQACSSPARNRLQKLKVSDTPNVKQRLTALSRQRLRLRREKKRGSEKVAELLSVIDESPVKLDTSVVLCETNADRVSKLTRHHSFYCSGVGSRNASRAQVIHHHEQVVPLTPKLEDEDRKKYCKISDQELEGMLNNETKHSDNFLLRPEQLCPRRAMKSLFQSPARQKPTQVLKNGQTRNYDAMKLQVLDNDVTKYARECLSDSRDKEESPQTSQVTPTKLESGSDSQTTICLRKKECLNLPSLGTKYFSSRKMATSPLKSSIVIRTSDTITAVYALPVNPLESETRHTLEISPPTRSDINRWPRKKREVDQSSPVSVAKKRKKLFDNSDELNFVPIHSSTHS